MLHSTTQASAKAAASFKNVNDLQQLRSIPSAHATLSKEQDKRVAAYLQDVGFDASFDCLFTCWQGLRDALPLNVAVKEGLRKAVHHVDPTLNQKDGEKLVRAQALLLNLVTNFMSRSMRRTSLKRWSTRTGPLNMLLPSS